MTTGMASMARRTRRSLLTGTVVAAAAGPLAACQAGGSPAAGRTPLAAPAPQGRVTWLVRNTAFEVDWEQNTVLPDLKQKLPSLEVDLAIVPGGAEYDAKLTSMVVGGSSPEVWTHWGGRSYVDYVHNGWLEDLTALIARDKLDTSAFLPGTLDWFKLKGKQYALPFSQSYGSFVFYNKSLLAQAGLKPPPTSLDDPSWTWDALIQMAQKLTSNPGTPQAVYGFMAFADSAQFLSQTLAKLWGGDIFLPEHYQTGIAQKTQLDSAEAIAGHQARQDLIFRQHVIPTPDDAKALGVQGDLFQAGKIALNLQAGWAVRNYSTGIKDFDWGIAPIPAKKQSVGPNFTDAWMLGKQAPNKEGGWALIKYLLTPAAQQAFARVTGTAPAIKAAEDEWFKLMGDHLPVSDVRRVTDAALKHSFELSQHTFAKWAEILAAIRKAVDPIWQNQTTAAEALRAGKPVVDQIVAQAYQEYQGTL